MNEWNYQLVTHIFQILSSVYVIKEEHEIDEILSDNIIFCNIINGSSLIILNECIVRETPIIINKHPVAVELLGEDYPLYYTGENEMVISMSRIEKAHKYLSKLGKTTLRNKFHVNTFIASLNDIIN